MFDNYNTIAIIKDYRSGLSANKVADKHNCSKRQILRILDANNIQKHSQKHSQKLIDQVRQDYSNGSTKAAIIKKYNLSPGWVSRTTAGLMVEKTTKHNKYKNQIIKLFKDGLSITAIENKLKCGYSFARSVLRKEGFSTSRNLSDTLIEKIRSMYQSGMGSPTISKKLGIDKSTILKYVKDIIRHGYYYNKKMSHNDKVRQCLRSKLGSARKTKRNLNIDIDFLCEMYHLQKGRCAMSGVEMLPKLNCPESISIDRIDNGKGYVKKNIRLVCSFINLGRNTYSDRQCKEFIAKMINKENITSEVNND
jgi:transposase